jgi:hypothetical protein
MFTKRKANKPDRVCVLYTNGCMLWKYFCAGFVFLTVVYTPTDVHVCVVGKLNPIKYVGMWIIRKYKSKSNLLLFAPQHNSFISEKLSQFSFGISRGIGS